MQAGVNKIWLYEDNGISFYYHDDTDLNKISGITTSGQTIEIENKQLIEFEFNIITGRNRKILFEYQIKYFEFDLSIATIEQIQAIKESIYGWKILVLFYDGTYKFYNVPFFCSEDAEIDIQESMAFDVTLAPKVPTTVKHLNYETVESLGVRADTTLVTSDSTVYTADYSV